MSGKENGVVFRKKAKQEDPSEPDRIWMSVKEMGDLLGIRKTDRYRLVHKNVFETGTTESTKSGAWSLSPGLILCAPDFELS